MKTQTAQTAFIIAFAALFATAAPAQGNKGRSERYHDRDERHHDYHGNKNRERDDDRDCEHYDNRNRGRGNSYNDYGRRYEDYNYPVVRYRPSAPPNVHPGRQPSRHHVWIPAEYRWRKGGYVHYPGYWMVPPRSGMQYVPGFWQPDRNGGYVWVAGFWSNGGFSVRL